VADLADRSSAYEGRPEVSDVAVLGGTSESRLVIRGLLRMNHHRVVFEGPGPEEATKVPTQPSPKILLVDGSLDTHWNPVLRSMQSRQPPMRVVLITGQRASISDSETRELGIAAVLPRPFTVAEFSSTMDRLDRDLPPADAPATPGLAA
jgi:CheY-like chemotaxis protein